jgi:hypothetical protein
MTTYLITKNDLERIVSNAKVNMTRLNLPLYMSHKEVEQGELVTVAILQAAIMFFNNNKCFGSEVEMDFTDPACDHDNELPLEQE